MTISMMMLTMAEVVVGLNYVLALQEKANKISRPAGGMTIFGRKIPTSIFPSNVENSGSMFFYFINGTR